MGKMVARQRNVRTCYNGPIVISMIERNVRLVRFGKLSRYIFYYLSTKLLLYFPSRLIMS